MKRVYKLNTCLFFYNSYNPFHIYFYSFIHSNMPAMYHLFSILLLWLNCLSLVQPASLAKRGFSGDGTYYDVGPGSCGSFNGNDELVAALNHIQMGYSANPNNNPNCGRTALVTGPNGEKARITIVDTCPGCGYGSLDLSPVAYRALGGTIEAGRVHITWRWAD
ncbi:RlpA-like double-psi beta-barrel-protein domain-containing protein-containing protein [Spinellus fusiger]|nr:RlpA-like double-psi beta-barrel-protein domain-containing protein-containing protein [Spinellus fusiger]